MKIRSLQNISYSTVITHFDNYCCVQFICFLLVGYHTPTMLLLGKKFGLFYIEQNFADAKGLQSKKLVDGPYTIQALAVDAQRGIVYFTDSIENVSI